MSKGGSQKTSVKIPEWLEQAARQGIRRGDDASRIGYMPYHGPDVAAMNAQQMAAMANTQAAAQAFGMAAPDPMEGMPQPETFAGGVRGYSSTPLFEQARDEWQRKNALQASHYNNFFRG